jgi:hypothetical protein
MMVQVGVGRVQVASAWHVRLDVPDIAYPVLQAYVALEPYVVAVRETEAFVTVGGAPQSTELQVGATPLQLPSL